ncbi:MAG: PDZ domain-containing protein [bacterium]|nr:PDZ domain-containing protein [bacterium]
MSDTMKDEDEISRMLAGLKAVESPDNFEGGVRSRIAVRRDEASLSRPSLLLAAKFAFPMLLLLAIGGSLILFNERELSGDLVPPVGDGSLDVAVIEGPGSGPTDISSSPNVNSPLAQVPVNRGVGNSRAVSQGGSEDIGLSSDDSTVFPDGVDPRKAIVANGKPPGEGSISPVDVLSMIGISTNCSATGCAVTSVRDGSIAAAAGIESGDLISAIDDRPLNSSRGITGKFTVSELTIVRSGKRMTVSIARR